MAVVNKYAYTAGWMHMFLHTSSDNHISINFFEQIIFIKWTIYENEPWAEDNESHDKKTKQRLHLVTIKIDFERQSRLNF